MERRKPFCRAVAICALILALGPLAQAQYAGGSGTPEDPYLIYTPEQMNAIGADPNHWDKHFKLMADIDLAQYTGTEFNLIGSAYRTGRGDTRLKQGFTGIFDGNGHTISNFTYTGEDEGRIGLFRYIHGSDAEVRNLGLITPTVDAGLGDGVGALVSYLAYATITNCYVEGGRVTGHNGVGGLIGSMRGIMRRGYFDSLDSDIADCHSTCDVVGASSIGGLVGSCDGLIADCCSTSTVTGEERVGGLVGSGGEMIACYADGIVQGSRYVGGVLGRDGSATNCYARGFVIGDEWVGGLAGGYSSLTNCYAVAVVLGPERYTGGLMAYGEENHVVASFWDVQTSRQQSSVGGVGKTTSQMQTISTYLSWREGDSAGIWTIDEGNNYPRLAWEGRPGVSIAPLDLSDLTGAGTADDPYLIYRADEMELIACEPNEWGKHFKLMADIDLSFHPGVDFNGGSSGWHAFTGVFDGNGHTISNFTYLSEEWGSAGFFAVVTDPCARRRRGSAECDPNAAPAAIKNLGLLHPVVDGRHANYAGALVGYLECGTISNCYVDGGLVVGRRGTDGTGGLVGESGGEVVNCGSTGTVIAPSAGGLVGTNWGQVAGSYSRSMVRGEYVGGLVGSNGGSVTNCYSRGAVAGTWNAGGLVAGGAGRVAYCYSASVVTGQDNISGLIGWSGQGEIVASFWDVEMSAGAAGAGTALATSEMMTAETFLEAGWDFVGEAENGVEEIWWIDEGVDYPRLWWERADAEF